MTIAATAFITAAGSTSGTGPFTSASKTWVLGNWYVLWVNNRVASGTANLPTVTINGISLTQIRTDFAPGGSLTRVTPFAFLGDGSTGVATIDVALQTQASFQLSADQWTGALNTGTNGINNVVQAPAGATGQSSTIAQTLAAFADATNNAAYIHAYNQGGNTMTPKAGYTGLSAMSAVFADLNAYIIGQDTAPNETQGVNTDNWLAVAMEIAAAGAAAPAMGQLVDAKRPPRLRGPLGLQRGTPFRFDTSRPAGGLITGNSSTTMTFGMSADASVLVQGASSSALAFGMTADGTVPAAAAVTSAPYRMMIPMRPTAGGLVITRPVQFSTTQPPARVGDSSTAITFGSTAAGVVTVTGTTSAALLFGMTAAGAVLVQGASSQPIPFGTLTDVPAFIGTDIPNIRRRRR